MAKKRQPADDLNQLSFDFEFNATADIIDSLQAQIDVDEDEGAQHAYRSNSAAVDRGENPQADDDSGRPAFALVPPAGLEDPRPLGVQQPGETALAGSAVSPGC